MSGLGSIWDVVVEQEADTIPWPLDGQVFDVVLKVGHVGPYIDEPHLEFLVGGIGTQSFEEFQGPRHMMGDDTILFGAPGEQLPIASGVYQARLVFTSSGRGEDYECGYAVENLRRLGDLDIDEALTLGWV